MTKQGAHVVVSTALALLLSSCATVEPPASNFSPKLFIVDPKKAALVRDTEIIRCEDAHSLDMVCMPWDDFVELVILLK